MSSIVKGRFAIFHLILKKDWEVINFEDEIFTQVSDNDYQLDGIVPSEGKVQMLNYRENSQKFS